MFGPFDWNGNGEHDFFDDFMTYKLINGELDETDEEGEADDDDGKTMDWD